MKLQLANALSGIVLLSCTASPLFAQQRVEKLAADTMVVNARGFYSFPVGDQVWTRSTALTLTFDSQSPGVVKISWVVSMAGLETYGSGTVPAAECLKVSGQTIEFYAETAKYPDTVHWYRGGYYPVLSVKLRNTSPYGTMITGTKLVRLPDSVERWVGTWSEKSGVAVEGLVSTNQLTEATITTSHGVTVTIDRTDMQ